MSANLKTLSLENQEQNFMLKKCFRSVLIMRALIDFESFCIELFGIERIKARRSLTSSRSFGEFCPEHFQPFPSERNSQNLALT